MSSRSFQKSHWPKAVLGIAMATVLGGCASTALDPEAMEIEAEVLFAHVETWRLGSPSAALFTRGGERLVVGDRTSQLVRTVDLATMQAGEVEVGVRVDFAVQGERVDVVYLVEEVAGERIRVARFDPVTEQSQVIEIEEAISVSDVAVAPKGERLYLGDLASSSLAIVRLEEAESSPKSGLAVQRMFLESGPAGEVVLLGAGTRLLVVNAEERLALQGPGRVDTRLGAEMGLFDAESGRLVNWYWSKFGYGTASVTRSTFGSHEVLFALEDRTSALLAYPFEEVGRELGHAKQMAVLSGTWSQGERSRGGTVTRLALPLIRSSAQNGILAVFRPGFSRVDLLEVKGDAQELYVGRKQRLWVDHPVSDLAVSSAGTWLAALNEASGEVSLYRMVEP